MVSYFSMYVQLKSSFSDIKTLVVKFELYFWREAVENKCGKVLKQNTIIGKSWSSAKLFINQNYTDNPNGDVPLTVENV